MAPEEYVKKEFTDQSKMTPADWHRKMSEYAVITNADFPLEKILALKGSEKEALKCACKALYDKDVSDYENSLYLIFSRLSGIDFAEVEDRHIKQVYILLSSR